MAEEREESAPPQRQPSGLEPRTVAALAAALLLILLVVIFIAQNGDEVKVNFLWLHGHMALGVALLIAAVIGLLLAVMLNAVRIVRRRSRRKR